MIEMVVAMAIMVIVGAALIPAIANYVRDQDIENTFTIFKNIGTAIGTPSQTGKYKLSITKYPGKLSQLTTRIVFGASGVGDPTSCFPSGTPPVGSLVTYSNTQAALWRTPFYSILIPTTGFDLPIGPANDRLNRTSINTLAGLLQIQVPNVPYDVALDLNIAADGPTDPTTGRSSTTGSITYAVPVVATEMTTVNYNIPVGNSC
jgi:type II secretory pathway pseudopilin PulG